MVSGIGIPAGITIVMLIAQKLNPKRAEYRLGVVVSTWLTWAGIELGNLFFGGN